MEAEHEIHSVCPVLYCIVSCVPAGGPGIDEGVEEC
jgi:hypothetical protein